MKRNLFKHLAIIAAASGSGIAMAAGPDMSTLTSVIDFGTVTIAILAIAGTIGSVLVAIFGAKKLLAFIRG